MILRLSALALLCLGATPLRAEPATPEGAARTEAGLRTCLGPLDGVVALGKKAGVTGAVSPVHLTLTDQGGGWWGVVQDEPFAPTLDVPGAFALDLSAGVTRGTGVRDEALMAFASSEESAEDMRVSERFDMLALAALP